MRKPRHLGPVSLVAGLLALVVTGCGGSPTGDGARSTGFAHDMVTTASRGLHITFEPLASPADAVRQADLIVTGTLVTVAEGIDIEYPDPGMTARTTGNYATFEIQVRDVLAGEGAGLAGQRIYVQANTSVLTNPRELAALNPQPDAVAVLADITTWAPMPTAKVRRPANVPAEARLYYPFWDGFWLQGPKDQQMAGMHAEVAELSPEWGAPRTVKDFAEKLTTAAKGSIVGSPGSGEPHD